MEHVRWIRARGSQIPKGLEGKPRLNRSVGTGHEIAGDNHTVPSGLELAFRVHSLSKQHTSFMPRQCFRITTPSIMRPYMRHGLQRFEERSLAPCNHQVFFAPSSSTTGTAGTSTPSAFHSIPKYASLITSTSTLLSLPSGNSLVTVFELTFPPLAPFSC